MATLTYTTLGGITAGAPNVASDVTTAFTQAQTAINSVDDTQYTNQNNSVWKTVGAQSLTVGSGVVAGTYWSSIQSGSTIVASGGTNALGPVGFMLQAADFAVTGKTTTLRVNAHLVVNATGPGTTLTFGLHPVSAVGGGAGLVSYTLGAAVAGSTIAFASPSASTGTQGSSAGFAISALGASTTYVFGCVLSGTTAANSVTPTSLSLQMRHV